MNTSHRPCVFALAASLLACSSCLAPRPVRLVEDGRSVAVLVLQDSATEPGTDAAPEPVVDAVESELTSRGFTIVGASERAGLAATSARTRSSSARLRALRIAVPKAELHLLVELSARYESPLQGRYRWHIDGRASVIGAGLSEARDFSSAAYLRFHHQGSDDALAYSATAISREIGALIDDNLRARDQAIPSSQSSGASGAVYLAMVDRFANGDRSNDGIVDALEPRGWHGGDLDGLIDRLDWLRDRGADTLWLTPLYRARPGRLGDATAYHGYWVWNHYELEPRFGSWRDVERLRTELDARAMKLWIDVVVNHVGYDAPLVVSHPGWFHHDGPILDWDAAVQIETYEVHGLPDLNQDQDAVYAYLFEHLEFWIERAKPDGLRFDAVKHVPLSYWRRLNADLESRYPSILRIAEHYDGNPKTVAEFVDAAGFDGAFDFPLYFSLVEGWCDGYSLARIGAVLAARPVDSPVLSWITLVDNHDLPRIRSRCGESKVARSLAAIAATVFVRGTPSLTWGSERGVIGNDETSARATMIFEPNDFSASVDRMMRLRRAHEGLRGSGQRVAAATANLVSWYRWDGDSVFLVALSRRAGETLEAIDPCGKAELLFESDRGDEALRVYAIEGAERACIRAGEARQIVVRNDKPTEGVRLVGAGAALGDWAPTAGPEARGGIVELEARSGSVLAFKWVRLCGDRVLWESGPNRYVFVPRGDDPLVVEAHANLPEETALCG